MSLSAIDEILESVSTERIRAHIRALEGIRHPGADLAALERAGDYICTTLNHLGYELALQRFRAEDRDFSNILASRQGLHRADERILILAHYDTVSTSPGADDNASAVAVLLELATVFQAFPFDRTVQFAAVNLEEREREQDPTSSITRGSRILAAFAKENDWHIAGVIVLECVAYAGAAILQKAPEGMPVKLPESGDFIGVVGNQKSAGLVQAFAQAIVRGHLSLPYVPLVVPGNGEMLPDTRRSDHAPFWDLGYRAIMLTDTANFRNPNYHQATDTLDTLNLSFATDVCRAVAVLAVDLAGLAAPQEE